MTRPQHVNAGSEGGLFIFNSMTSYRPIVTLVRRKYDEAERSFTSRIGAGTMMLGVDGYIDENQIVSY
jgi:hypothetical protein